MPIWEKVSQVCAKIKSSYIFSLHLPSGVWSSLVFTWEGDFRLLESEYTSKDLFTASDSFLDALVDIPLEAESLLIAAVAAYRAGKYLGVCETLRQWKGSKPFTMEYNTDVGHYICFSIAM